MKKSGIFCQLYYFKCKTCAESLQFKFFIYTVNQVPIHFLNEQIEFVIHCLLYLFYCISHILFFLNIFMYMEEVL